MTTPTFMTEMPPLPEVGALDWGPDVNACLVWLYEQMEANANSIAAQADQIETLQGEVTSLQGQVFNLQGELTTLAGQVSDVMVRLDTVEAKPEYIFNSAPWQFSNGAPPATGNQVRLNNVDPKLATLIDIRLIDVDGADRARWFSALSTGCYVRISDWNASNTTHRFKVSGVATIGVANASIPVTWDQGNGLIPNAKADVGFLVKFQVEDSSA
jgi:hypothetical protein